MFPDEKSGDRVMELHKALMDAIRAEQHRDCTVVEVVTALAATVIMVFRLVRMPALRLILAETLNHAIQEFMNGDQQSMGPSAN